MSQALPPTPIVRDPKRDPNIDPEFSELVAALCDVSLQVMWMLRQDATKAFEPLGLRPVKALLLELVGNGLVHPKELADILDTVPPAVSAMLAELAERGLITRAPDPQDGRRVRLTLTEAGGAMRESLKEAWLETGTTRLSKLTRGDLKALIRIYRRLLENP